MRRRGSFEKSFVEKIYHFVSKMRSKGIAFFLIGENTNSGPAGIHFFNQYFLVKCIQPIDFYFLGYNCLSTWSTSYSITPATK